MFSDLEERAFRAPNGEFGWRREDVRLVVPILVTDCVAILGGEVWWVPDGADRWTGLIPQRDGPDAVYPWETKRDQGEEWMAFVRRCAAESLQCVDRFPADTDLPPDLGGQILYNVPWVSEDEYLDLDRGQGGRSSSPAA